MTGYVYFASNPTFQDGYVKIGRTDRPDVRQRIKELKTSGVPKPFEIVAVFACEDSERLERDLHDVFGDKRVDGDREFFQLDRQTIKLARKLLSSTCMDLTDFFEARKDEPLPDDGKEPPGSKSEGEGFVSLSSLEAPANAQPVELQVPSGDLIAIGSWRDLMHEVVKWLVANGNLSEASAPIRTRGRYLLASRPQHPSGASFRAGRQAGGLFVETHHGAEAAVRYARRIVDHGGADASKFAVRVQRTSE